MSLEIGSIQRSTRRILPLGLAIAASSVIGAKPATLPVMSKIKPSLAKAQMGLPDGFIENEGQWDARGLFYSPSRGADVWITRTGIVYDFYTNTPSKNFRKSKFDISDLPGRIGHVVELKFVGSNSTATDAGVTNQKQPITFFGRRKKPTCRILQGSRARASV